MTKGLFFNNGSFLEKWVVSAFCADFVHFYQVVLKTEAPRNVTQIQVLQSCFSHFETRQSVTFHINACIISLDGAGGLVIR